MRYDRPRQLIDSDDVVFTILFDGEVRLEACGREAVVYNGDGIMMGAGEGGFSDTPGDCRFLSLRLSASAFGSRVS